MRSVTEIGVRTIVVVAISFTAAQGSFAHPGSGIVVDDEGQVYFAHTSVGIWKIDVKGQLHCLEGPGNHFLALDADGDFIDHRWPCYREEFRPSVFRRYGDSVIEPVGTSPTLIAASSFPIAIGPDGALYYPEPRPDERVHIRRMAPSQRPTDYATLPEAIEINYHYKAQRVPWIHGLAAGADGTLYYAEKEAVRRVAPDGTVSLVAEDIEIPGCVHGPEHRGGPILRGLDVTADGTVYVAASGCGAVVRITPEGATDVPLKSEDSWTPSGIAVKGDGVYVLEFWFADPARAPCRPRVRKLSPDGSVTILATVAEVPE